MRRIAIVLVALGLMVEMNRRVDAGSITYTETAVASGRLGATTFADSIVTITAQTDTSWCSLIPERVCIKFW